jgi:hypothetical protein
MADFIFPDAWLRDRKPETNDLGFTTILGSASGVSPWWDFLRGRQLPDSDGDPGYRGIAPKGELPPAMPLEVPPPRWPDVLPVADDRQAYLECRERCIQMYAAGHLGRPPIGPDAHMLLTKCVRQCMQEKGFSY